MEEVNSITRRVVTVSFWPITDFVLAVAANILLVNFGALRAVVMMIFVGSIFNIIFLRLLSSEREFYKFLRMQVEKMNFVRFQRLTVRLGKAAAVLIAYVVSGPAMVGAPLIWLLGIRGRRAYTLAILGITLNTIVWVGGLYNLFWTLVKTAMARF